MLLMFLVFLIFCRNIINFELRFLLKYIIEQIVWIHFRVYLPNTQTKLAIIVHPFLVINSSLANFAPYMHMMIFCIIIVITYLFTFLSKLICNCLSVFNYFIQSSMGFV